MGGALVAAIALLAVALIAMLSRRQQRRRQKPDPNVGAALLVRQVRTDFDAYEADAATRVRQA